MRLSRYFLPLLKETPSEAQIISHQLMLRAGMVRQSSAGIYSWLPLGFRVLKKVEQIVRAEMDRAGCHEVHLPADCLISSRLEPDPSRSPPNHPTGRDPGDERQRRSTGGVRNGTGPGGLAPLFNP